MKKIVAFLFSVCLLLTSCSSAVPAEPGSDVDTSTLPASSEIQANGQGDEYDVMLNPYNAQTAITEDYIFAVGTGAIYRIDRKSGESEVFISEETHDVFFWRAVQTIVANDETLYFVSPNHLINTSDQTTMDTFEQRLFRADIHDGSITQVGVVGNAVYSLHYLEGYFVAHYVGDIPGAHGAPEVEKDYSFKVFVPDNDAPSLEELVYSSLDTEARESIEHFVYVYQDSAAIEERLYGGSIEEPFYALRANDAYYYLDFYSRHLYNIPMVEGDKTQVEMSSDIQAALHNDTQIDIVNYDADWLYCTELRGIFRIRKDGSEYQRLVSDGVDVMWPIDVTDGHVFYRGQDGALYMDNETIGQPNDDMMYATQDTMEATVIDVEWGVFVCPDSEVDRAEIGERINIQTHSAVMVDDDGQPINYGNFEIGSKVTLIYKGYYDMGEYIIFQELDKIILHR